MCSAIRIGLVTVSQGDPLQDILFACGGPIVRQYILQTTVSTSSIQAEYQAVYAGMQELVRLWGALCEIGRPEEELTSFFIDREPRT